ncbi:MAG: hypothetical protein ABL893_18720, partial [Hyphomicrobium sp.]
ISSSAAVTTGTAPKSESASLGTAKCRVRRFNPRQTSSLDFDAVAHTVKIAKRPGKVAAVVLNGCKWGSGLT